MTKVCAISSFRFRLAPALPPLLSLPSLLPFVGVAGALAAPGLRGADDDGWSPSAAGGELSSPDVGVPRELERFFIAKR